MQIATSLLLAGGPVGQEVGNWANIHSFRSMSSMSSMHSIWRVCGGMNGTNQ